MIEVQELAKSYGAHVALSGVSFAAAPGEIVGLLGPNGAGKTTLMRILAGYLAPSSGTATLTGLDVRHESLAVRTRLGYLPESAPLHHEMRVSEYLRYRAALKGVARRVRPRRIEEAMTACGVDGVQKRIIGQLSKGYRQRVSLAATLLHDPPVLILDEPTVGLDPNQQLEIRVVVKNLGLRRTVLFSTHILSEAEAVCDRVVIIDRGRVAADGTPRGLAQRLRFQALRVEAHGDVDRVLAALGYLPGLQVEMLARTPRLQLMVRSESSMSWEHRAVISEALGAAGALILEMTPTETRLEEIFRRLTGGEEAA